MVLGLTAAAYASKHVGRRQAGGSQDGVVGTIVNGAETVAGFVGLTLWAAVMIGIFVMDVGMALIPAYLAYKCNPKHPFIMTLVGFFFSEIYLFQFLLRKFVIREKGYCAGAC